MENILQDVKQLLSIQQIAKVLNTCMHIKSSEIICSPSWELRTASPRGPYVERRQRDPCMKHTYKNTTCWPATAYDVTTGATII